MPLGRLVSVDRRSVLLLAGLALLLGGCGGEASFSNLQPGEISGVVFDPDGNVVRDARVFVESPTIETRSNSSGSYVLRDVRESEPMVKAEVTQNGVRYIGQNLARVFELERSKNVNIVVVPENQVARIHGTVENSGGGVVQGARVFAIGENNLSSAMAISDSNGNYTISRLAPGIDYEVHASSPDFRSDSTIINLSPGENDDEDFVLTLTTGVSLLNPPSNLSAVSWTAPDESTRSRESASAYEAVKQLFDPKRAARQTTRATPEGEIIEVDLTWDRVNSNFLLGYGIYRALGVNGTLQPDDFLRDPLAEFFADADERLSENTTYSYAMTSVNTDQDESDFSTRATVRTLGQINVLSPQKNPLRFRWDALNGAEKYVVYVFDEAPRVGVSPIWDNEASPTTGTSLAYGGPALNSNQTYYFVVLALANENTSRSLSPIVSFTP